MGEILNRMRLPLGVGLMCGVLLYIMPLLWVQRDGTAEEAVLPPSPVPVVTAPAEETRTPKGDDGRQVRVLMKDGTLRTMPLSAYLWGVVAAEMPASFEPEALRAQAVCARTYTAWKSSAARHEGAEICADSSCCQAYTSREDAFSRWGERGEAYADKIAAAVADTDGVILIWEGKPIQAVFFSSSAEKTEDAAAVWGASLPYLVSVDSPEGVEVPNYHTSVTFSAKAAREIILAAYPEAKVSGSPERWFSNVSYTASGRVESVDVGGVTLSGGGARTLFSLRSACFTVEAGEEGVTFSVTGYGHGVGMSQYGANAMAKTGRSWREILLHYYTGVELGRF